MTDEREKFFKKLRSLDEEDVRAKQATNHFGPPDSKRNHWAQEWLREKEKENDIVGSPGTKQQEVKQKEQDTLTAVDKSASTNSQTKNRNNVVKTAFLIGGISLIIFIVTLCSGSPA